MCFVVDVELTFIHFGRRGGVSIVIGVWYLRFGISMPGLSG